MATTKPRKTPSKPKAVKPLRSWSTTERRVCSRCHVTKPIRFFRGKRAGGAEIREFKTCGRCRQQIRELAREKAAELLWLREEAPIPYAARGRRRSA